MKVHVTDEEARAVVAYYDVDGSGEMSYGVGGRGCCCCCFELLCLL